MTMKLKYQTEGDNMILRRRYKVMCSEIERVAIMSSRCTIVAEDGEDRERYLEGCRGI